jgi:hypothetical protein
MKNKKGLIIAIVGFLAVSAGVWMVLRQRKLTLGSKEANDALKDMQMY